MKALVYHGPGQKSWETVPDPQIAEPSDAIVKMETTTICGTDLHILKGDVPAVTDGRVLGHEGVGVVVEVGASCEKVKVGDRVIVSCITKCGSCDYCVAGLTSHCQTVGGIGWIFGHLIDGTQAELVRVPYADNGLIPCPRASRRTRAPSSATSCPPVTRSASSTGPFAPVTWSRWWEWDRLVSPQ